MYDKIVGIIICIALILPLISLVKYLIKMIVLRVKNRKTKDSIFPIIALSLSVLIVLLTLFCIVLIFIFPNIYVPKYIKYSVGILGLIYYFCIFVFAISLSSVGHAGLSPNAVFEKVLKLISNSHEKKNKA